MKRTTAFIYGILLVYAAHGIFYAPGGRFYLSIILLMYISVRMWPTLVEEWYDNSEEDEPQNNKEDGTDH